MKEYTITMTSKGQFTLPVELRREFGVNKAGDVLKLKLSKDKKQATLSRPRSFDEIQAYFAKHRKPGVKPLLDPRVFYDTRPPRL